MNRQSIAGISSLLVSQPYISDVGEWHGERVDFNLDRFRLFCDDWQNRNLADSHLDAFNLPRSERDSAWLEADPVPRWRTLVSRSLRYHGNYSFWDEMPDEDLDGAAFVGFPREHELFCEVFGRSLPLAETPTVLDVAGLVAGCGLLLCNQNLCRSVAEGLKAPVVVEEYRVAPSTRFDRPGARYV